MKRMTTVFDSWTGYDTKKLDFDVVEKPLTVDTPAYNAILSVLGASSVVYGFFLKK